MAQMGKFAAAVIRRGTKTSSPTNFRQLDYTLPFGCNFAGTHLNLWMEESLLMAWNALSSV
jgi:hypothetical protein